MQKYNFRRRIGLINYFIYLHMYVNV